MEEILNSLISIDDECKKVLHSLEERQDNIEYLVNDELSKRKNEIKTKYKFKIDMRKNEYDMKLSEMQKEISSRKLREIEEIKEKYNNEKEELLNNIVKEIL